MRAAIEAVPVQEPNIVTVAEMLARAFYDDPSVIWIEPDSARRARMLPVFYEVGTRYAHLFGEAYTSAGNIEGAALWIAPGSGDFTSDRMAAAGGNRLSAAMGPEAFGRFVALTRHFGRLRKAAMPSSHWYLNVLGVEPSRQGMGIGSQLIQPILQRADESVLVCYLETMKARNVAFYRQHGFEVVVEGNLEDGSHYWTMHRYAQGTLRPRKSI
ncbi:MAG TPA: GNAT family N-acetyltransferase [Candidatus Acidoferrales bacterium]|nr:GNAT family N-acetyltransferase [Candidatus Acidoferrales bacterium]